MIVTYPSELDSSQIYRQLNYTFITDTANNNFSIYLADTLLYKWVNTYSLSYSRKTYYLSSALPRRVIKISFRQTQNNQTLVSPPSYISYDILFDYDDYTSDPNNITVINYSDTAGTQITREYKHAVVKFENDYYIGGTTLDILNCDWYTTTRMSPKSLSWYGAYGNFYYDAYSDTSFEVNETDPFYYNIFFSHFTIFPKTTAPFGYTYIFGPNKKCRTFAVDMLGDNNYNVNTPLYGQRKFDFDYSNMDDAAGNLFALKYYSRSLYWEKVAQQSTDIILYADVGGSLYQNIDSYLPDLYSYYQDICSSYTDSLFTTDSQGKKVLYSADKYTNKVEKDKSGNILSITKYSSSSNDILRYIKVGY